jgi:two-component system NarL family response regulator
MGKEATIRVLVADDHPVVREGLRALISRRPDMRVVAEAATAGEAIRLFARHQPDVTLLDLRLPDMDGIDALVTIRGQAKDARVIVLTSFGGDEDIYRAIRAGASAYLLKDAPRDELVRCVRAVHGGGSWISPVAAARLTARLGAPDLTPRERDVLRLVVAGKSNKEIGDALHVALGTVKAHVNRIFSKLRVGSRAEAVTTALRRGIVPLDRA